MKDLHQPPTRPALWMQTWPQWPESCTVTQDSSCFLCFLGPGAQREEPSRCSSLPTFTDGLDPLCMVTESVTAIGRQ